MSAGIDAGNVFSTTVIRLSITPAGVAAIVAPAQTFTVPGVKVGDAVTVNPPAQTAGVAIANAYVSAANTVSIQFVNPTAGALTPAAGNHTFVITRFDGTAPASRVLS